MKNRNIISSDALGQSKDGKITISNSIEEIIELKDSISIVVEKDVEVFFMDTTKDKEVHLEIERGAKVNYFIVDSKNTYREFIVLGSLEVNEISLEATKEEFIVQLNEVEASVEANTLSLAQKEPTVFTQLANHNAPSTFSNLSNVGVAMESAEIVFHTTGKIEHGNSKSKCQQLSKGVIMDDTSTISANPILLIDEYDCFANHGASIGKMSDDDLFYLMSRGLNKSEAFLLILQGMIAPFIEKIENEEVKTRIQTKVTNMIEK